MRQTRKIRTLLVDDSERFLEEAARFLSSDPRVEIVGRACSGPQALDLAADLGPDLVLMDVAIPGMNGLEATRRLKAQAGAPLVVMLTLHGETEYAAAAKAVGADALVAKTDLGRRLLPLIHDLFEAEGRQAMSATAVCDGDALVTAPNAMDRAPANDHGLRILVVGEDEDDALLIRRLIEQEVWGAPPRIERASSVAEAARLLAGTDFDVLLVDYRLPDAEGLLKRPPKETVPAAIVPTGQGDTAVSLASAIRRALETRRLEQRRRESEERYRRFFEADLAGVLATSPDGRILDFNPAAARIFGVGSVAEVRDRNIKSLYADPAMRARILTRLHADRSIEHCELEMWRPDGKRVSMLANVVGEFDEGGELAEIRAFFFDITEYKKVGEQFRQAQKMEAVGQLAGGVAHDFNNLLGVMTGHAELLLRRLPGEDALRRHAEEIVKAGERAATITRQLLAFSRKQILQPRVLDLNAVVADFERMLGRLIGEDIDLVARLAPELGRVRADAGQIEQVLMNLAVNARDAMPDGGRLAIETANVELDEPYASRHLGARPGAYVMLAVSDSGHGMDAETQARIFEPFFTTKERGRGTGLGLSTVYGIVKQSGGYIAVYSEPGQGTVFKIYLPRVAEAGEPAAPAPSPVRPVGGSETILLVEDEPALRDLIGETLKADGYSVLAAGTPGEAVALAQRHAGPIRLLMTDVVMPGMNGHDLAKGLAPARPEMKVLYMSGYTEDAIVHHGVLDPRIAFLSKPFTASALTLKVREVLGD